MNTRIQKLSSTIIKCLVQLFTCGIIALTYTWLPSLNAESIELHPKIEEALNRETPPEGFIFDVQSSDPDYYYRKLSYIDVQLDAIQKKSNKFRLILLSRGKEVESLITAKLDTEIYKQLQNMHKKYDLRIQVAIEVAAALGYTENSFPSYIEVINNSYITIVSGRKDSIVVIELQRMSMTDQIDIQVSPTWRTDAYD